MSGVFVFEIGEYHELTNQRAHTHIAHTLHTTLDTCVKDERPKVNQHQADDAPQLQQEIPTRTRPTKDDGG
jgi:hypothetical protein